MPTIPPYPPGNPTKPKQRNRRKRKAWKDKTFEQKRRHRVQNAANQRRELAHLGENGYVPAEVAKQEFTREAEADNQSESVAQAIQIAGTRYYREGATPEERRQAEEALPHLLEAAKREFPLRRQFRRQAFQQPPSGSKNPVDK